jgi:lysophospholipid acyltransferase (LPLAT)-like uncharacterized protein
MQLAQQPTARIDLSGQIAQNWIPYDIRCFAARPMTSTISEAPEEGANERRASFPQRLKAHLIAGAGYWAIRLICKTLRWEVSGWDNYQSILAAQKRVIFTSWHGRILMATYFWRHRGIMVMTSMNRDGEYIARVIQRFGYRAARGSSSRGGNRALAEMLRALRRNQDAGFTIDGPRGPRYIAKPGAIWLAGKSGNAVLPFHISAAKKWVLSSWDLFHIPKPFSRVLVLIGSPIYVEADANADKLRRSQAELQTALEELLKRGDSFWDHKLKLQ